MSECVCGRGRGGRGGVAAGESHRRRRASRSESHRSLTPLLMITGEKGKKAQAGSSEIVAWCACEGAEEVLRVRA